MDKKTNEQIDPFHITNYLMRNHIWQEMSPEDVWKWTAQQLWDAIKEHKSSFPDEPLEEERKLWAVLDYDFNYPQKE